MAISEVMSSPAISIAPDAGVKEAARLMAQHKIGCLTVLKGAQLVGIVTETDVLDYFARS